MTSQLYETKNHSYENQTRSTDSISWTKNHSYENQTSLFLLLLFEAL